MNQVLAARAQAYAARHHLRVGSPLGSGQHGNVFVAQSNIKPNRSAIKVHKEREAYLRECRAYRILASYGVVAIEGLNVPQFLGADDELLVIDMTIVERPFVLDFAGAYLERPEFSDEIWADWLQQKQEQFEARWPVVENVLSALRGYGIHLIDVTPSNIGFRES